MSFVNALGPESQVELPIIIKQGADFNLPIYIVDCINGIETPTNLTGWTAHMQGRISFGSDETLFDLSTSNGGIVINALAGTMNIYIPGGTTATFPGFQKGRYDLKIFDNLGAIDRYIQGPYFISSEVTQ